MRNAPIAPWPAVLVAALTLASSVSAGGVRIASATGGPSYPTLQQAIDAAVDGDVLLIGEGSYSGSLKVQGKSLSLFAVGDPSQTLISAQAEVRDLPADGEVLIHGLTINGRLAVSYCEGMVRLQDCTILGADAPPLEICDAPQPGYGAVRTHSAQFVSFVGCSMQGGVGEVASTSSCFCCFESGFGGPGVLHSGGQVALYDCALIGGSGGNSYGLASPGPGGVGLGMTWSVPPPAWTGEVFASGCGFVGGDGGIGPGGGQADGAYAAGLNDTYSFPWFAHLDCSFESGEGPPSGGPIDGPATEIAGLARRLGAPTLVMADASLALALEGVSGDELWVLRSTHWAQALRLELSGVVHLRTPLHLPLTPLGVVPSGGVLQVQSPGVSIPAGEALELMTLQGLVRPAGGPARLSGPRYVLALSPDVGPDCDGNGVSDYFDVVFGGAPDANHNLIPDTCPGG